MVSFSRNFDTYLYLNFEKNPSARVLFEKEQEIINNLVAEIFLFCNKENKPATDILDTWRGKIAEQIVAQELLALDNRVSNQRDFWVRNKKRFGCGSRFCFTK